MEKPLAVYTVVIGHPFDLQPIRAQSDVDYICFTDHDDLDSIGWTRHEVVPLLPGDPMRSSRDMKIRPHRFLQNYTRSLYIDSSVLLRQDPMEIWNHLMPSEAHVFGGFFHSFRETVGDEFKAVTESALDYNDRVAEQRANYEKFHPQVLDDKPVWGGFLARRHNDPDCIAAMETWFAHVLRYSRRDQLSLTLALSQLDKGRIHIVPDDIQETHTHQWPVSKTPKPPGYTVDDLEKKKKERGKVRKLARKLRNTLRKRGRFSEKRFGEHFSLENTNAIFGFDATHELHFVDNISSAGRVYVSDKKRLDLYKNGIAYRRDWILRDYRLPPDLIRSGDIVIDIGANIGEIGLWVADHGGHYIAFEPDPTAYKALQLNVPDGHLYDVALSDQDGEVQFYLNTEEADSSLFKPSHSSEVVTVRAATLTSFLEEVGMPSCIRLLKVEAEGMEPEVLAGASAILERVEFVAVDAGPERGGENTVPEVLRILMEAGFRVRDCFLSRGTFLLQRERVN